MAAQLRREAVSRHDPIAGRHASPELGGQGVRAPPVIAIPNFIRAKIAANEAAGVAACKKITTAEVIYPSTYNQGYPQTLAQLRPPGGGPPNMNAAGLLDEVLTSGTKHGYIFTYVPVDNDGNGLPEAFTINADPIIPGSSGNRHFYTDPSGVVRQKTGGAAGPADPPIG